jgi:putative DNA primase/helicase
MTIQDFLGYLQGVRKTGTGHTAKCPAHEDKHASLSISEGNKGILVKCHAGCDTNSVLQAIGVTSRDLFYDSRPNVLPMPDRPARPKLADRPPSSSAVPEPKQELGRIVASYPYLDEQGQHLFDVVRFEPKTFRQRRRDPATNRYVYSTAGVRRVLYRLPALLAAHPDSTIWVVEGEKDVHALEAQGLVATCSSGGAGKWKGVSDYVTPLLDRDVIVIPDNDEPGRAHARDIVQSLIGVARFVRLLELPDLPEKGDVSDWLAIEGNDAERLCMLAESAIEQTAAPEPPADDEIYPPGPETANVNRVHPQLWRRTHEGLAYQTLARINGNLKWVADFARDLRGDNAWAWWNGQVWTFDAGAVAEIAEVQRQMTAEYRDYARDLFERCGGDIKGLTAEEKAAFKFTDEIESSGFKSAWKMEMKTHKQIHKQINDFDRDPWLLTVTNGVIDLKTGEILDFNREHLNTKRAAIRYDSTAKAPRWRSFLYEIFAGNQELIDYIQAAVGYSLTGDTSEQCLFLCHGAGANGKSVLLEVLLSLTGEFGMDAPMSTFAAKNGNQTGASNDLAMLRGTRLVTASETNEGMRLDEALIKKVTGQDKVTARKLYQEFFSYTPQFKLWLAMNHRPSIRGVDNGIWRRIRMIPFSVVIPPDQQDRDLKAKLLEELPGILNWAIEGCLRWQREGLKTPQIVLDATAEYRSEQDVIGAYLDECCEVGTPYQVKSMDLYADYKRWAEDGNEYVLSIHAFGRRLTDRGFPTQRNGKHGVKFRSGLRLLTNNGNY